MKTQRFFTYVTAAALATGTFGLAGCKDDATTDNRTPGQQTADAGKAAADKVGQGVDATKNAANEAGREIKEGAQQAGEKMGEGVDATKRAANEAGQDLNQAGRDAGQAAREAGRDAGQAAREAGRDAGQAAQQAGAKVSPSNAEQLTNVRSAIEGVVQNAVKRDNWRTMTGFLTAADERRLNEGKPDTKALDDLGEKFTTAYREKYKNAFTVMDRDEKFNSDFVQLQAAADPNGNKATANIPASHGMPAVSLPFVNENGKWKLDVPDTLDPQTLHTNLTKALTELQDMSKFPETEVAAARHVAHRILAAVTNAGQ